MKILVVDDELLIRTALARAGELKGHLVKTAEDGPSALKLWKQFNPDVVFLDVLLPRLSGPAVLNSLSLHKAPHTKVIMMSAHQPITTQLKKKSHPAPPAKPLQTTKPFPTTQPFQTSSSLQTTLPFQTSLPFQTTPPVKTKPPLNNPLANQAPSPPSPALKAAVKPDMFILKPFGDVLDLISQAEKLCLTPNENCL